MLSKNLASHHDSQGLRSIMYQCSLRKRIHTWMFVAVGGLEPPTSAILRRFANLASRHTMYI